MTYLTNYIRHEGDPRVLQTGPSSLGTADRLARGLGWFSIGLGLAELLAADRLTRALGMEGREDLVRAYGAREIASGILTLSTETRPGLLSRLAGDGIDIATLLSAMHDNNPKRGNVGVALAMVLGVTLLDAAAAQSVHVRHRRHSTPRDYSNRSGFPKGVQSSRGAASDFMMPQDMHAAPSVAPHEHAGTAHRPEHRHPEHPRPM